MRGHACIALAACAALAASRAEAQPIAITVPEPDACLDAARLGALIRERESADAPVDRSLRVVVERVTDTAAIAFTVERGEEVVAQRRFEAPPADCDALHEMLALAIAIALDGVPAEPVRAAPPPPLLARQQPSRAAASPVVALRASAVSPRASSRAADLALELSGLFGVLPETAFGGSLALHLPASRAIDVRFALLASLPAETPLASGAVDVTLAALRIDGCYTRPWGSLRARGCLGFGAGKAFGQGQGFRSPYTNSAGWVAVAGRAAAVLAVTQRLGIDAGIDLFVPVVRPSFVAHSESGSGIASTIVPGWGLAISVGPALLFP